MPVRSSARSCLARARTDAIIAATKTIRDMWGAPEVGGSISAQEEICTQHRGLAPGWKSPVRGRLRGSRRDRPARALAQPRSAGQARLRWAAHVRRRARTRRTPPSSRASTSRSWERRPTISSPTGQGRASGRVRSGRRAARPGPTSRPASTRFAELRIVDFGDAPVLPADPERTPRGNRATSSARWSTPARSRSCSAATTRSRSRTCVRARAARPGRPRPLRHAHRHRHARSSGSSVSHGTPMYRLVEQGHVDPRRYVQVGLRGYWPGEGEFGWQAERGITSHLHARRPRARDRRRRRPQALRGRSATARRS